jgi:AAA15 family ATPase/GTPase
MSETLTIKNFGPIKSVKLELKRFNILIGENATGKSTVAKVLAVCRYFSYIAGNSRISFSKDTNPFFQGLASWGMIEFLKVETYIEYQCRDYIFKVESNNSTIISKVAEDSSVTYSSAKNKSWSISLEEKSARFANLLKELKKLQSSTKDQPNDAGLSWIPTSFYQNDVASVLDNPFYLPTERGLQSIFSLGKSSIPNISDSLYNQFSTLDLVARNFNNETLIEPFNIIYKNEDGIGFIKNDTDQNFYNISNEVIDYIQ